MAGICSDLECSTFKGVGVNVNKTMNDYEGDEGRFIYCKKKCEEQRKGDEENRNENIDNEFEALNSDLSKRQNEMSTTDQFVKDTTQLWRFEKNKFIFLILCLILISLCALYMVYKNTQ